MALELSELTTDGLLTVVPWNDPVVEAVGFDVRSTYVELFWLNVLGPTATWTLRRLSTGLDRYPLGYEVDLDETAGMLGLAYSSNTSNSFGRALQRLVMFGMAQPMLDSLAVRRRVPPVAGRHLARMPERLQELHATWQRRPGVATEDERGRRLAETMFTVGDDPEVIERQLLALGVPAVTAAELAESLLQYAA